MISAPTGGAPMNRREFSQTILGTTIGMAAVVPRVNFDRAAAPPPEPAAATPFPLSIMLWTIYRNLPFEHRLEKVAEAGYNAVELVGEFKKWSDADYITFNRKKRELGIMFD